MPPELLQWADIPTITLVIVIAQVLRPLIDERPWFLADPDRIIIIPLVLGLVVGVIIEWTTPSFDPPMALRRVLVDAFGSAGMFKAGKTLFGSGG